MKLKIISICIFIITINSAANEAYYKWQETNSLSKLKIVKGYQENGEPTRNWHLAIQQVRGSSLILHRDFIKKKPTQDELLWKDLIIKHLSTWESMLDSIAIPFLNIKPKNKTAILIGNQKGEDAFVFADSIICFDLARLFKVYGPASENANDKRITRIFAHEYTHILHKIWRKNHSLVLNNPYEKALWLCLTEGIGNYRSLSDKWIDKNGVLSGHARKILEKLQNTFVTRMKALKSASEEDAAGLMEGLSMGPFTQKWGALTVALWIAQDVKGDEKKLQTWVEKGPKGVIILANKYLPEDLKLLLNSD